MYVVMAWTGPALGAVVEYTSRAQWQAAAASYSTITFTEIPVNTLITNQYAHLGALFTDGSDFTHATNSFLNDGIGLNAALDETTIVFTKPMTSIGCDYPGGMRFTLFSEGEIIYVSTSWFGEPIGSFAGLVTDQPFDQVLLQDPSSGTFLDDLYFGPPIPGPGAFALMAMPLVASRRRNRD